VKHLASFPRTVSRAPAGTSSRPRGLFVTGTDTGVGKTIVSAGLLRLLARAGRRPVPFKPVETGCRRGIAADARHLRDAALRSDISITLVCPLTFSSPVAPAAAARAAGTPIRPATFRTAYRRLEGLGSCIVVEGAGGLLSPYAPRFTGADLAQLLALPVLLIARNALGTINHTALALAEIARRRLPLVGYILVTTQPTRQLARQQNPHLLTQLTGIAPLAVLPHFRSPTPDQVADELARQLPHPLL
jgi:dethiobiotin synthetase